MLFVTPPLPIVDHPADANHHGGTRVMRDMFIVLHHTGGTDSLDYLSTTSPPSNPVSCHRLIAKDGTNYKIVPDYLNAWTQGGGILGGMIQWAKDVWKSHKWNANHNGLSIEIENRGNGKDPYPDEQVRMVAMQIVEWWGLYGFIPILYHGHIDARKNDPRGFPRDKLDRFIAEYLREVL